MKKLTKFDVILNIWVSLIINIALSAVLPALNGFLAWGTFFSGFAIAFPVSTILVFVLPVVSWAQNLRRCLNSSRTRPCSRSFRQ